MDGIKESFEVLDCGNSGTGIRLFCGLLSSANGHFVLTGDKYLRVRPMKRVTQPLRDIGAKLDGRDNGNFAPLSIRGASLKAFDYKSKIASAQVKSAMILAALRADKECKYTEPELSRDHTERMLKGMGADIKTDGLTTTIKPLKKLLNPLKIRVPADPSSAFFFAVAASIVPNSHIVLEGVTLNPTRVEAFMALKRMGADITFIQKDNKYEPIGDIEVKYAPLKAIVVEDKISWLIDELPALSIAFACADGKSVVKNAKELRVKESDRISTVVNGLKSAGIEVTEYEDGYEVVGGELKSAIINSHGDHRIAMSFIIAGLKSGMQVDDLECINTSFPNFFEILSKITKVEIS
jgi:3-phosphoshikimate 1-carboxyvinyltransferase